MHKFLFLVLFFGISSSLVGCGEDLATLDENGVATLTFWTFADSHADYFQDAADSWNEQNPDRPIKLDTTVLPFDQMHQNLLISLLSGTGAPDLVDVEVGQAELFLNHKNPPFLALNEEIAAFEDYLVPSRLENFIVNGDYFAIDYHVGTMVMYYNEEILESAGVDYREIRTWEQFVEAGKVVVAETGKWMTQIETANTIAFDGMIAQQGKDYTVAGRANFGTEESIRALNLLHDMIYEDEIARPMVGGQIDSEEFYAEMNNGNLAALMAPAWYMGRFLNQMPNLDGKIAVAPLPVFNETDNRSSSWGGTATMVTNQANHEKLAKEFAVWAKSDFNQAIKQWTVLGFDPVRWDVWESDELRVANEVTQYFGTEIFDTLLELQDETSAIRSSAENSSVIRDHFITNVLPNVISQPDLTPEAALKNADELLNAEFDRMRK